MRTQFLQFVATFIVLTTAHAGNLSIDETQIDFGEKYQFTDVKKDVQVWNKSPLTVSVHAVNTSIPAATAHFDKTEIAPYSSAMLHVTLPLDDRLGTVSTRLQIQTEEAGSHEVYDLVLSGYVDSVLDDPSPGVDFGVVDAAKPGSGKDLRLSSSAYPALRATRIVEAPDFLDARIGQNGADILLKLKKFDVLGFSKGVVKVAIDAPVQSQVWINVLADIHGEVVPDQNPLAFGMQRPSLLQEKRLQLTSRSGEPFKIGAVTADKNAGVSIHEAPCLPEGRIGCRAYLLNIDKNHHQGGVSGKIGFELPDTRQFLNVELAGLFLKDDTVVDELPAHRANGQTVSSTTGGLANSIKKSIDEASPHELPGFGPVLKWQIANESAIYGYAIYRGDSADGKFVRVNDEIVRADNGGDNTTANYQWRDTSAAKGREYWYYITIFNNSGKKTQLTGPQKVVAK